MAIKIIIKGPRLKPDLAVFTKLLHQNMKRLWIGATRAFLEKIALEDIVKVDTGMSRSSLIPLGRAVQMVTMIRASISPLRGPRKGYTDMTGTYHKDMFKSKELGEQLGESAYTLTFGDVCTFTFRIVVYQYYLHENGLAKGSGPWNSLEQGRQAFLDYVENNKGQAIPKIAEWFLPSGRIG